MSYVQNVIVWTMVDEDDAIAHVQEWLTSHNHGQLVDVSDFTKGHKGVEAQWWGIATNYLEIPEFLSVVFAQNWEFPDHICVILEDQNDDLPTIYRRGDSPPE